jgi:hypothetical protein
MDKTTFKDLEGKVWDCRLTLAGAMRIDKSDFEQIAPDMPKFSILNPSKTLFNELLVRQPVFFACIFAVCLPQVKANLGIDLDTEPERMGEAQKAFMERLDGTVIEEARDAFWGTLADFFPEKRTALSMLMQKWKEGRDILGKEMTAMGPEVTEFLTREITDKTNKIRAAMKEGPEALNALEL